MIIWAAIILGIVSIVALVVATLILLAILDVWHEIRTERGL